MHFGLVHLALLTMVPPTGGIAWTPPAPVVQRVTDAAAAAWHVTPDRIRLTFEIAGGDTAAAHGVLKLAGDGSTGVWTLAFAASENATPTLWALARAGTVDTVPVAARALPRDIALSDSDVTLAPVTSWGPPSSRAGRPVRLTGWVTRRMVAAGEPLRDPAVVPPQLITSGSRVTVLYSRDGVEIRLSGTASGSASFGELVTVRIDTKRRVRGVAAGPALVRID
jgi:flagella basal body P-ring formation protein FlgA